MFGLRRVQSFRTTGASIELDITYTNMKNKRAQAENEGLVKTTIKATVQTGAWSSVGATASYDVYPTGEAGAQTCVATLHCPSAPPCPPRQLLGLLAHCQPTASPPPAHCQLTASPPPAQCIPRWRMPTHAPRWSSARWKLLSRYKQGVMVNMKSSGTLYTFNFMFLVQALVTGLVLLKVANTIADLVAFNLLPGGQSLVLANKRAETVSK